MKGKLKVLMAASSLFALLFAQTAQAANIINDLFESLFGKGTNALNIAKLYGSYSSIIDFALLTFFFVAVANFALKKRFGTPGNEKLGATLSVVVGFVLAFGTEWWMSQNNLTLGMLGPIGAIIVFGIIGICIFYLVSQLLKGETKENERIAMAAAYLLVYLAMKSATPGIFGWLEDNVSIIAAILEILFLLALIYVVIGMWKMGSWLFRHLPMASTTHTPPGQAAPGPTGPATPGGGGGGGGSGGGGGGGAGGPAVVTKAKLLNVVKNMYWPAPIIVKNVASQDPSKPPEINFAAAIAKNPAWLGLDPGTRMRQIRYNRKLMNEIISKLTPQLVPNQNEVAVVRQEIISADALLQNVLNDIQRIKNLYKSYAAAKMSAAEKQAFEQLARDRLKEYSDYLIAVASIKFKLIQLLS